MILATNVPRVRINYTLTLNISCSGHPVNTHEMCVTVITYYLYNVYVKIYTLASNPAIVGTEYKLI